MEENNYTDVNSIKLISSASQDTLSTLASLNKKTFSFFNDNETKSFLKQISLA